MLLDDEKLSNRVTLRRSVTSGARIGRTGPGANPGCTPIPEHPGYYYKQCSSLCSTTSPSDQKLGDGVACVCPPLAQDQRREPAKPDRARLRGTGRLADLPAVDHLVFLDPEGQINICAQVASNRTESSDEDGQRPPGPPTLAAPRESEGAVWR